MTQRPAKTGSPPTPLTVETYIRNPDGPGARLAVRFDVIGDNGRFAIRRVIIEPASAPVPADLAGSMPEVMRLLIGGDAPDLLQVDDLALVGPLRTHLRDALVESVMTNVETVMGLHGEPQERRDAYRGQVQDFVSKSMRRQRITDDFLREVVSVYKRGGSWQAVAKEYSTSERSVRRWLAEADKRGLR